MSKTKEHCGPQACPHQHIHLQLSWGGGTWAHIWDLGDAGLMGQTPAQLLKADGADREAGLENQTTPRAGASAESPDPGQHGQHHQGCIKATPSPLRLG